MFSYFGLTFVFDRIEKFSILSASNDNAPISF